MTCGRSKSRVTSVSLEVALPPASQKKKNSIKIVIDTREKEPYSFPLDGITTTRRKLETGDYSLDGFEDRVTVERKSMDDFVSTVIHARSRFHKELKRLQLFETACVVVEGSLDDVLRRRYHGNAHPNSVFGSAISIIIDFGIPVYFCSNRQVACRFVEGYLQRFHRKVCSTCENDQQIKT